MAKRSKRLKKQIWGLEKQIKKHTIKLETEPGRKDTTHGYWKSEISNKFIPNIEKRREKLLRKKKR